MASSKGTPANLKTFPQKTWKSGNGKTVSICIPAEIADSVEAYAMRLDEKLAAKQQDSENADRETDKPTKQTEPSTPKLEFSNWQAWRERNRDDDDDDDEVIQVDCYEFGAKTITISLFENAKLNKCPIATIQIIS